MFDAGWRLRKTRADVPRSFRSPALPLLAVVGILAALGAIAIGFVPPSQLSSDSSPLLYAGGLLVGIVILAIPPQIIYAFRRPSWSPPEQE